MKILFVCTGNSCRSPMAEGIFNNLIQKYSSNLIASSAGLCVVPGSCISRFSVEALKNYNIDISNHIPTQLDEKMLSENDLIITLSQSHKDYITKCYPQYENKIHTFGCDIFDPYGGDFDTYKECASQIYRAVTILIERICSNE